MSLRRYVRQIPSNYSPFGMYRLGVTSGIIPATPLADKEVFQFRWNPANRSLLAVLLRIRATIAVSTTFFAAGVPLMFATHRATGWSGQGTLGTAVTIGAEGKLDTQMASSGLVAGDMRIAGTDANGLGAGTKTFDTNALANIVIGQPITSSLNGHVAGPLDLYDGNMGNGGHPIVLRAGAAAANAEGIAIRATAPATGTWRMSLEVEWLETDTFPTGLVRLVTFPLDPGYGPNGERLDPSGLVTWQANPPPTAEPAFDDVWSIYALGITTVPFIDQNDDEGWQGVYLGGV